MSFVAIPGLIGPMLGPIVGGLIVGYLQWRFIFFVSLPVGIAGLVLVYLHLPDYRETNTKPLDIVGLILFGSGVALLSYVLEIFGEHAQSAAEILGLLAISLVLILGYGLHATRIAFPLLDLSLVALVAQSSHSPGINSPSGTAPSAGNAARRSWAPPSTFDKISQHPATGRAHSAMPPSLIPKACRLSNTQL
jgi:MFS family permease